MAEERHVNSKRITIFRSGSFLENAQTGAQDFMSMSKKSIGSYFSGTLGPAIGTGLEFEEIDVLMPRVIDIPKDDRTFRPAVTEFYKNLATPIPFGTGKELEIGLKLDNGKLVTYQNEKGEYNLPIHMQDYLRYRHAKRHPLVAPSKSLALGNMLKEFYIFDEAEVNEQNATIGKRRDEALGTYLAIQQDMDKVDAMLTLLDVDIRAYHGVDAPTLKLQKLYELCTADSDRFMNVHDAKHFEYRFLVQKMLNTEVIRKIGAQLVDKETGAILGHNVEEVIYYLQDVNNSDKTTILKSKTQEAMKKKLDMKNKGRKVVTTRA